MSDLNIPVTADGDVLIDCDNNNDGTTSVIKFTHDNGTELARIQEDGKVGIGTASPSTKLHVSGGDSTFTNSQLKMSDGYGLLWGTKALYGYSDGRVRIDNSQLLMSDGYGFQWGSSAALYGYATTGQLRIDSQITTINIGTDAGDDLNVGSGKLVVEGDSGNVGIGTTSPAEKLDVSGNIKASGTVAAGNEGLKWKVYSHQIIQQDIDNSRIVEISWTATQGNIRGIVTGGRKTNDHFWGDNGSDTQTYWTRGYYDILYYKIKVKFATDFAVNDYITIIVFYE